MSSQRAFQPLRGVGFPVESFGAARVANRRKRRGQRCFRNVCTQISQPVTIVTEPSGTFFHALTAVSHRRQNGTAKFFLSVLLEFGDSFLRRRDVRDSSTRTEMFSIVPPAGHTVLASPRSTDHVFED